MSMYSKTFAVLASFALCISPLPALAWGNVGHATVANVAQANLEAAVLTEIQGLLAIEGATTLADVASWADTQRLPGTPIHSTRVPVDGSPTPEHPCPDTGMCADEAVLHYGAILGDRQQSPVARLEALKYVVHLVGDLHQPLHGSDPIGYNMVLYGLSLKGIHAVWDKDVVEDHSEDPVALASELMSNGLTFTLGGTPRDWAVESSAMARDHIFDTLPACYTLQSPICPAVATLPSNYSAVKYPLAAQRLKQAGLRLAQQLNEVLG